MSSDPHCNSDLQDLGNIKQAVLESDVLVILQSERILERPWCLVEMVTALDNGIPIVNVCLTSGLHCYDFGDASTFLQSLDVELGRRNPGAGAVLAEQDIDVDDAMWKLSCTLPRIVAIGFNPSASRAILTATISDITEAIKKARPLEVESKEDWRRKRELAPPPTAVKSLPSGHQPVRQPFTSKQGAASQELAAIPPEVPALPAKMVTRPDLIAALKAHVLHRGQQATNATAVTAPATKSGGNTTTAAGMGGGESTNAPRAHGFSSRPS